MVHGRLLESHTKRGQTGTESAGTGPITNSDWVEKGSYNIGQALKEIERQEPKQPETHLLCWTQAQTPG